MHNRFLLPLLLICFLGLVLVISSFNKSSDLSENENSTGISFFNGSWQQTIEEAKRQNKLIFLDAYASWFGPCKQLKRKTFPDKEAGLFYNENFISIAIDMEKGEGPALAEKFGVTAYPTLIITDPDGNPLAYTRGFMNAKDLIRFGKQALSLKK
jgi:thiol:disulfide interchange protein